MSLWDKTINTRERYRYSGETSVAEAKRALAKSKYASKVCTYLGVDKSKCEKVFDKLFENMKLAFEHL